MVYRPHDLQTCFRSFISVITLVSFIVIIPTLQSLSILISETAQSVYGQTQVSILDNNILRDLLWTSHSLDTNLKPTTSGVITISDNGNNNTTPFLLPSSSPSSIQSSGSNSSPAVGGLASTTSPSNNNFDNSKSPSQNDNSNKDSSTNNSHDSHTISQTITASSNSNHVSNQIKNHKQTFTGSLLHKVISQSNQQFTGGEIPFP
jgi:hypothetical protein